MALTEIVGGLMLVFGLFTRFAALAVTIFMINAVWFTQSSKRFILDGGRLGILDPGLLAVALVLSHQGRRRVSSIDGTMSKEL